MTKDKYILWGIPVLFIIGSLFHFIYEFTGSSPVIALISPVNESVFEHMKMVPVPLLAWWLIGYFKLKPEKDIWFTSAAIAMITAVLAIPFLFYFYTSAFGIEVVFIDIMIFFIAVLAAQLLALHYYNYGRSVDYRFAIAVMIFIIIIFAVFTFYPPKLPIFRSSEDGTYGIS